MATLSQAKMYGGIGSILVLLSVVPTVGFVIAIVGLILTIIAVKYIGDIVQDPSIFRNIIIGIGVAIIGAIVVGLLVFASLFSTLGDLSGFSTFTTLTTNSNGTPVIPSFFSGVLVTAILGLAALWILLIISAIFVRKSYGTIAQRLNVGMFKTAALIYLIGAILTVIFVGLIIVFVAQILLVVAFFSISENVVTATAPTGSYTPYSPPPPPPGPTGQTRTCPKCGAPVASDSVFCPSCGSSLSQ